MSRALVSSVFVALVAFPWLSVAAQNPPRVRRSQPATLSQTMGTTVVTVKYNRPVARGRELFGQLVPYGRVWHPGADEATSLEFSADITFAGQPVAAGKYTLWTIPGAEEWTIILSKAADVFHTPYPGEARDLLRVQIKPKPGAHMESLAYYFPVADSDVATLVLHWGQVVIEMPITVKPAGQG